MLLLLEWDCLALACTAIESSNAEAFLCPQARRLSGEEPWQKHFRLQKRKDHFLWTIESTGIATVLYLVQVVWNCVRLLEYAILQDLD